MAKKIPVNATVRLDKKASELVRGAAKGSNRSINNEASTALITHYENAKKPQPPSGS